eukprot:TRINITY_DN3999_c0_g1_i2.p1 TRINITY_DN3999_c0_g1~~TRINITY_DN3999_c0_g1_i2.p1  ORF type:complete len:535 (-),score=74.06 TRINITY_DN3999_c0_g1_i2:358-1851(-)
MAAWSWRTLEDTVFQPADSFQHGVLSLEDAKRVVEEHKDEVVGFSFSADNPDYVWIAKVGTVSGKVEGWTSMVYAVRTLSTENLYSDGWSGRVEALGEELWENIGGWARPGRGQGLGASFPTLSLMTSVDPNDMVQGAVGNCWLISALACAAEYKSLLASVVEPRTLSETGKYTLTLYDYGLDDFVSVSVDDSIPLHPQANMPAFANFSETGEIWPMIFEKAFAKMAGSYARVNGGFPTFAFGVLTGCTDLEIIIKAKFGGAWQLAKAIYSSSDPRAKTNNKLEAGEWPDHTSGNDAKSLRCIVPMLEYYEQSNYMLSAGSNFGSDSDKTADGIAKGHAYSILQVRVNIADSGITLIQLRNPWGVEFFKGEWNDDSKMWKKYPKVRRAVNFQAGDDGLFWMTPEDFEANFSTIFVCKKNLGPNREKQNQENLSDVMKQCAEAGVELPFKMQAQTTALRLIAACLVRCLTALNVFTQIFGCSKRRSQAEQKCDEVIQV